VSLWEAAGGVGYAALPAVVALESLGVPLPGETTLIAAAVLAAEGHMDIALVIPLAIAAAVLGDNAGYLLGRRVGRPVLLAPGPLERHRRRMVAAGDAFFARHGSAAVFLGRWVAIGRVASAWLAGADRMPWRRFAFWNALGAAGWATSVGLAAYALGSAQARWLAVVSALAAIAALARVMGVPEWLRRGLRR